MNGSTSDTTNRVRSTRSEQPGGPVPAPHRCELPDPSVYPLGTVWQCRCGLYWQVAFFIDNYWTHRDRSEILI